MMWWLTYLTVAFAGALGALLRFALQRRFPASATGVPRAILFVNLAGSLVAGILYGLVLSRHVDSTTAVVIVAGFCGGLTTFSTFSVETVQLLRARAWRVALINVGGTVIGGFALAVMGFVVTRAAV